MSVLSHAQMQDYLRQAGWPATHLAIMSAIGMAESSGRTNAGGPSAPDRHKDSNGRWSVGVWQINATDGAAPGSGREGVTLSQLENPLTNASKALDIFRSQGFRAWGTYTSGKYKTYLAAAQTAAGSTPVSFDGNNATPAPAQQPDYATAAAWALGLAATYLLFFD
jgi:hypothetical protein